MEACKREVVIVISKFKDGIFISSYPVLRSTCVFDNCIVRSFIYRNSSITSFVSNTKAIKLVSILKQDCIAHMSKFFL